MPHDFRNKSFQKVLRGYSPDEVEEYIAYFNEEYRKLERKNTDNERKLALALKKLEEYQRANEPASDSVRETEARLLRDAENKSAALLAAAEKEAGERAAQILEEAEAKAEVHKNDAQKVYDTANSIYQEVGSFRERLFELYNTHLDAIEGMTDAAKAFMTEVNEQFGVTTDAEGDASEETAEDAAEEEFEEDYEEDYPDEEEPDETQEEVSEDEKESSGAFMDSLFSQMSDEDAAGGEDLYIDIPEESENEDTEDDPEETPAISINWKNHSAVDVDESMDFRPADGFEDFDDEETSSEDESDEDFIESDEEKAEENVDIDSLFAEEKLKRDMSLTDEFNIIFADSESNKNVEEIRRQPTISPESPKNSKKHKKY